MSKPRLCGVIEDFLDQKRARVNFEIKGEIIMRGPLPIGQGARGDVFEAHLNGERVAVKYLRGTKKEEVKASQRLIRELFVWNQLDHQGIAPLYGLTYNNNAYAVPGIVSLFVENELLDYLASHSDAKASLILEIGRGAEYLHSEFVIHGDLKPDNVRVSSDGHAKIVDFGMGKHVNVKGCTSVWNPNPRYFAPELLASENGVRPTFKSDVYSFGMLILQVFHGRDLNGKFDHSMPFNDFTSTTPVALLRLFEAVLSGRRPLQTGYRNITQEQWTLLEHCWNKDPAERPSMPRTLDRLQNIL